LSLVVPKLLENFLLLIIEENGNQHLFLLLSKKNQQAKFQDISHSSMIQGLKYLHEDLLGGLYENQEKILSFKKTIFNKKT